MITGVTYLIQAKMEYEVIQDDLAGQVSEGIYNDYINEVNLTSMDDDSTEEDVVIEAVQAGPTAWAVMAIWEVGARQEWVDALTKVVSRLM